MPTPHHASTETARNAHVAAQCCAALGALTDARAVLSGMGRSDLTATLDGVRREVAAVLAAHTRAVAR